MADLDHGMPTLVRAAMESVCAALSKRINQQSGTPVPYMVGKRASRPLRVTSWPYPNLRETRKVQASK